MPYHVVAYTANTFGVTNFDSTPATDFVLSIQNGHIFPHMPLYLYGGWFGGANLTQVTLQTPHSRMIVPPKLYPIQQAIPPPDRPHMLDRRKNPFVINAVEELQIQMNIGGTASAVCAAIMFLGSSVDTPPQGEIYSLHGTSTTTATALGWTAISITYDQTIPQGIYTVVGSQVQSANALAHRIFFKDQILRPGFLSISSLGNMTDPSYYFGGWGKLGDFNTTAYPTIEVFANGADASHDVVLNLIRTG